MREADPDRRESPVVDDQPTQVLPEEITTASAIARGEPEPSSPWQADTADQPDSPDQPEALAESAATDESGTAAGVDEPYQPAPPDEPAVQRGLPSRGWVLPGSLIVVAVLLAAFAVVAGFQWSGVRGQTGNTALTDTDATNQVTTQVSNALNTLLTFDYKQPNKNDNAAKNLIDGKLGDCGDSSDKVGYDKLMSVLKSQGPAQQLTLKSTVLKAGVQQLQGDRAELLVLLDQEYSKGTGSSAKQSPAVVAATVQAVDKDGSWRLRSLCLQ